MKTCLICKTSYKVSNFKYYCSHECFLKSNRSKKAIVLPCEYCEKLVWKYKSHMTSKVFCNCDCANAYKIAAPPKTISQPCVYCRNIVTKKPSEFYQRYTKLPKNNFCSRECSGKYIFENNIGIHDHSKSYYSKRSKLEIYIDSKIRNTFPFLDLEICNRQLMNGIELDFMIPSINLSIEINGIVHYKPIYGQDLLDKIQIRDEYKLDFCSQNDIHLIVVKTLVKFTESTGEKIWNEEIKPELLKRIPFCENK